MLGMQTTGWNIISGVGTIQKPERRDGMYLVMNVRL